MKRRFLSMFVTLCMLCGLLPTAALAAVTYPARDPNVYIYGSRMTGYDSVTEAIGYAEDGDCIMVVRGVTENIVIPEGRNLSIFTYGNIGPEDETKPAITNYGTLRLLGNGTIRSGKNETAYGVYNATGATLLVQDDPVDSGNLFSVLSFYSDGAPAIVNEGNMTLEGCGVEGSAEQLIVNRKATGGQTPVLNFVSTGAQDIKTENTAIFNGAGAQMTIGDPESLNVSLRNCTGIGLVNEGSVVINEVDFYATGLAFRNSGILTINDGYFNRTSEGDLFENTGTLTIYKGHFSQLPNASYIMEGRRSAVINAGTTYESYLVDKAADLIFLNGDEVFQTVETIVGTTAKIPEGIPTAPIGYEFGGWVLPSGNSVSYYWPGTSSYRIGNDCELVTFNVNWNFAYPTVTTSPELDYTQDTQASFPYGTTVVLTANHPLGNQAKYVWYGRVEGGASSSVEDEVKVGEGAVYTASNLKQSMFYRVEVSDPNNPEGIADGYVFVPVAAGSDQPSDDNNNDNNNNAGNNNTGNNDGFSGSDSNSSSDKVTNEDGSTTTSTTNKDGSVTEKTTFKDGSESEITVNKDGSAEFEAKMSDGSTATATISTDGKVEAKVELSDKATLEAAKNDEVVPLPIPSVPVTADRDEASVITVSASDTYETKVEIPVENVTAGTVVILVDKNGNETIVTKSSVTEDGVVFAAQGDVTVKVVDNSKSFDDVKSNFWGNNSVAFVTSRELFSGTSADAFSPNEPMTRAMIFTVLARLDGQDPTGGANWWDKGMDWAKDTGLTDGTNPQSQLTREQLALMLYNYSGKPAVDTSKLDKTGVSSWAENAMAWCVQQGVMAGDQNGNLNAGSNATRAEVATMLMSFVSANNR